MKAFYFNYSHDVQLSSGKTLRNLSKNVRFLEYALQPLAAFIAERGDAVVVHPEMVDICKTFYNNVFEEISFVSLSSMPFATIEPWGWDEGIVNILKKTLKNNIYVPDTYQLDKIRSLSSRENVSVCLNKVLSELPQLPLCGKSDFYKSEKQLLPNMPFRCVLKAPWSSSGRGIRFVNGCLDDNLRSWIKRIFMHQGGMEVEPYYDKVSDWAMEFYAEKDGRVFFTGLSRFYSSPLLGYIGNKINSQEELLKEWNKGISLDVFNKLKTVLERILSLMVKDKYVGPLGVDMMFCRDSQSGVMLNPCVEINIRRTMGQIAQAIERKKPDLSPSIMKIKYFSSPKSLQDFWERKKTEKCYLLTPILDTTHFVAYLNFVA